MKNLQLTRHWLVLAAALSMATSAQAILIDNFTTEQKVPVEPGPILQGIFTASDAANDQDPTGSMIGGERDILVQGLSATGRKVRNRVNALGQSHMRYREDFNSPGFSIVSWDGDDNDGANLNFLLGGGAGMDFTEGSSTGLLQVKGAVASVMTNIIFTAYTDAGNHSSATLALPAGTTGNNYQIPYASFVPTGGAGADFNTIRAFVLEIPHDPNAVERFVRLDELSTQPVPEPTTLLLLGTGLVGAAVLRRRLK